jgi:hypothetical protein
MSHKKKNFTWLIALVCVLLFFYFLTGFFVIQPIGAIPEGRTIWYIRVGFNLPFISSADGLLLKKDTGVSLLGRAIMMSRVIDLIDDKILLKLPYSRILYKVSTNGVEFEQ